MLVCLLGSLSVLLVVLFVASVCLFACWLVLVPPLLLLTASRIFLSDLKLSRHAALFLFVARFSKRSYPAVVISWVHY